MRINNINTTSYNGVNYQPKAQMSFGKLGKVIIPDGFEKTTVKFFEELRDATRKFSDKPSIVSSRLGSVNGIESGFDNFCRNLKALDSDTPFNNRFGTEFKKLLKKIKKHPFTIDLEVLNMRKRDMETDLMNSEISDVISQIPMDIKGFSNFMLVRMKTTQKDGKIASTAVPIVGIMRGNHTPLHSDDVNDKLLSGSVAKLRDAIPRP